MSGSSRSSRRREVLEEAREEILRTFREIREILTRGSRTRPK